jgi:hypothetical protein
MEKNIPTGRKMYQKAIKCTKWHLHRYTKVFHSQDFKNIPKLVFFGMQTYHQATLPTNGDVFLKEMLKAGRQLIEFQCSNVTHQRSLPLSGSTYMYN